MHIIITDAWLAKSRAMHLSGRMLMGTLVLFTVSIMVGTVMLYHGVMQGGARLSLPGWFSMSPLLQSGSQTRDNFMRENLDAMARKLGEMQARMLQMESLGERVAGLAGLNPAEFKLVPGAGGVLMGARDLSMEELQAAIEQMDRVSSSRADLLTVVESRLFDQKIQRKMVPTEKPVSQAESTSPFGFRIDPFTGRSALHTGLDFAAAIGTPVVSAAGGVVVVQEHHHGYGNMVEIDHGNDIITRYAHLSETFVNKGDIVKRGQKIASVGSTGRSTGPHLHFEVWVAGVPQDPQRFLTAGESLAIAQAKTGAASKR